MYCVGFGFAVVVTGTQRKQSYEQF